MFPKATTTAEQEKQIEFLKIKIKEVFNLVKTKERVNEVHQK